MSGPDNEVLLRTYAETVLNTDDQLERELALSVLLQEAINARREVERLRRQPRLVVMSSEPAP